MQKTAGLGHITNMFNDRSGLIPGTIIEQAFLNTVQEELINLVSPCMDPIAPGTPETDDYYRNNQLTTMLNMVITGNWFVSNLMAGHSGVAGNHVGICADNSGYGEVVIVRSMSGMVTQNSIIGGNNNGIFFYPCITDSGTARLWTRVEEGENGYRMAIADGGGTGVESERVVRQSIGGGTAGSWTNIGPTTGGNAGWYGIATTGATWVICGINTGTNGKVYYSTNNGSTWTISPTSGVHAANFDWYAAGYGGGRFVIGGYDTTSTVPIIYHSTDGINWTAATTPPGGDRNVVGLTYNEYPSGNAGEWIASMGEPIGCTRDHNIYRSYNNGASWSAVSLLLASGEMFVGANARTFNNIVFIPGQINTLAALSVPILLRYVGPNDYSFVRVPSCDLEMLLDITYVKNGYIMVGRNTTVGNTDSILRTANLT